jgi:Ca-activated chloride channel family protein
MKEGGRVFVSRKAVACAAAALLMTAALAGQSLRGARGEAKREAKPKTAARELKIDLDKAIEVKLPNISAELKPVAFRTKDGKEGWAVKIPGGLPIATPAYSGGRLFVGGGYGSHEFYAFDAKTGRLVWKMKTSDDGPSAAVVEGNYVAFNTESCTLVVADARTGKLVWEEWLGDPLMSQPAISKGRVFMAYPAGQSGNHRGRVLNNKKAKRNDDEEQGSHRLLAADLRTGKHIWERAISADVISAPVISEDKVYFTTFVGDSYCLDALTGRVVWKKQNAGTSAPVVVANEVIVTQKDSRGAQAYEGLKRLDAARGDDVNKGLIASDKADYLAADKGGGVALKAEAVQALDSSVGFSQAPAAAELEAANRHLGVRTVVGGWAYQGSRAAYGKGRMMNAQGRYLNSVNARDGGVAWRAEVSGAGVGHSSQVFSPPALGDEFMYLSSSLGHLVSVRQHDGRLGFAYLFRQPMVFQPALAEGNVYVGTSNGLLICLKTGTRDADGWYAWGGNAEHNKNK